MTKYLIQVILAIRELSPPPPYIDGGTEPGTGENPDDTWTEITSLDGLEGTWKSVYKEIQTNPSIATCTTTTEVEFIIPTGYGDIFQTTTEDCTEYVKALSVALSISEEEAWNEYKKLVSPEGNATGSIEFTKQSPYKVIHTCSMTRQAFETGLVSGFAAVNQSKTSLKIEFVNLTPSILTQNGEEKPVETDAEWKQYQEDYGPLPSGDMKTTFSAGAPYTVTTTQILHKTSEVTDPGENPDSGTNPGTGTEPGTGEKPNDTWTKITSLDGLEGTWKYAYRDFGDTSNDNIYELINTTEFILFNETGDVSASYMTDHTQEVKELSLADNRPENEIWKEIQNIYKEIPSDFSYEFTQSEPYISKSFGTIPRAGEQGFETLLIGDGTNSCTYINESKTQLKMVSILESTIYVSETGSQRPIKDDAEWEQYKAQQAPFLPEGDMFVTYSKGETYLETVTTILHKQ